MKLLEVQVNVYRSIVDSTPIPIEDDVTCLVGKNESGKTAILQALCSLNPTQQGLVRVDVTHDYPRWRKVRDERQAENNDLTSVFPITAVFSLDDKDIQSISEYAPYTIPASTQVKAKRSYAGDLAIELAFDEIQWLREILTSSDIEQDVKDKTTTIEIISEFSDLLSTEYENQGDKRLASAKIIGECLETTQRAIEFLNELPADVVNIVSHLMPKFFYFSEYGSLPGRLDLNVLLNKQQNLSEGDRTALSLLKLAGVHGKEFMDDDFEVRIAELEAAASEISQQVFDYWTQNTDLIVKLESDSETINRPNGQTVVHKFLDIRLDDLRHHMTTNFEVRSTGFQWFFSFVAAFSEYSDDKSLIILLDEPGLGLHARAQGDLLRYIDEQLADNQVLYSTHSPFMVNPKKLERVRLVEDLTTRQNSDVGAKVSTDVLSVHGDTLFPLQAALGYDLAQNIFVGGHNLVVEGPSDLIYLMSVSEYLESVGRESLDEKFTIVPIGGIDKVPTFIALLGTHLDLTVLVDAASTPNQRIRDMINRGLLASDRFVSLDQVTEKSPSDIEDLFDESEYLELYNGTFSTHIESSDLLGNDSIIRKLERVRGEKFKHLKPATFFLREKESFLGSLSDSTLDSFEKLFTLLNETLS